jgi:uncharacterized protein (DUF433 family)
MVVLRTDPLPLRVDESGSIRVGSSRVTLDVLIADYQNGLSAEEIVRRLDTLNLADVHAAIAYYLRHRDEVEEYLRKRKANADALRAQIEAGQNDRMNLKAKLQERLASQEP